jgi:hypothetical protein
MVAACPVPARRDHGPTGTFESSSSDVAEAGHGFTPAPGPGADRRSSPMHLGVPLTLDRS